MKNHFYLQHQLMAMCDPRMQNLVKNEGLRGIGAYWYIIEKLAMQPNACATLESLRPFLVGKRISFAYLQKIILQYDLFSMNEDGLISAEMLNPTHKKKSKMSEENADSKSENDEKRQKPSLNRTKKEPKNTGNKLENKHLAKNAINQSKENIKDKLITATTEEKEETAAAAAISKKPWEDYGLQSPIAPKTELTVCDESGNPQRPLHPVRPWQKLADNLLNESSVWLEIAFMRSGYGALLQRHLKQAVEIFKGHIIAYGKGDDMLEMKDIQSYFINYVNAGSRTSKMLHDILAGLDAKGQADGSGTGDPYRFEQRVNGLRTYQGCPIPTDAPPRPDATAFWDEQQQAWITGKRGKS